MGLILLRRCKLLVYMKQLDNDKAMHSFKQKIFLKSYQPNICRSRAVEYGWGDGSYSALIICLIVLLVLMLIVFVEA